MKFEAFNPDKHTIEEVAGLIYDVDFRTFDSLYKSKGKAVRDISKGLLKHGDDNLYAILDHDKIIGIIVLYINKKPSFILSLKAFTSFKLLAISILDYFVIADVNYGDVYIAELAVSEKCRGKGIGSKAIEKVIDYARQNNFKRVTLDADFRNDGAKRLYEKLGFKVFNKKEFLKRGMYNMEYDLEKEK